MRGRCNEMAHKYLSAKPREGWTLEAKEPHPFNYASLYRREYLFKPYISTMGMPVKPPPKEGAVIRVDAFVPDYGNDCENCGQSPVVTAEKDGKLVYKGTLCGPCTWGQAEMADPKRWNE